MVLESLVHEVEDLIGNLLPLVKENLLLVVLPVKGQVIDADAVPVVGQLHACSVHDSLDLV